MSLNIKRLLLIKKIIKAVVDGLAVVALFSILSSLLLATGVKIVADGILRLPIGQATIFKIMDPTWRLRLGPKRQCIVTPLWHCLSGTCTLGALSLQWWSCLLGQVDRMETGMCEEPWILFAAEPAVTDTA